MNGYGKVKDAHEYTRNHLSEWFPNLPAYAAYIQRLNRPGSVFSHLLPRIQTDFTLPHGSEFIRLIDSMPIMTAKAQRSGGAEVAREIAAEGYNSTKKTYYYGLKLHVLALRRNGRLPLPDYIGVTAANEADISVLKEIADDLYDTPVYADKAYIAETLNFLLAEQNSPLNTPVKKKKGQHFGMTEEILSTAVSRVRQPIESLFNWIEEKTGIQTASKVRSTQGLLVHVFGKPAAAMLMLTPAFNS
ncbi:MAG: transposase [FCB group bacterium]|nr:transposase [FCB group bacterium]